MQLTLINQKISYQSKVLLEMRLSYFGVGFEFRNAYSFQLIITNLLLINANKC